MELKVDYCRASDGVRLAYAIAGSGPPLVKTANWMNHVEYDWESSIIRHFFVGLARDFTLLRYDARGNGLSDWDVEDVSLDAWVSDLETVVDAAGLDRFPLLGMSQGCAISVAFAVRHPERVSHLILYGGFARGAYRRAKNELELQKAKALATLIRTGWGDESPAFRQLFSSLFMPGGTQEQLQKFAERQRKTTSAECAYRYFETTRNLDVSELLAQGHRADACHAQARRPSAAVRGGSRACRRNSRRAVRSIAGTKPLPFGARPRDGAHARRD